MFQIFGDEPRLGGGGQALVQKRGQGLDGGLTKLGDPVPPGKNPVSD